jgi:replicative DNA helicase
MSDSSPASVTKLIVPLQAPDATAVQAVERLQRVNLRTVMLPRLERMCRPQGESFWVLGGRPGSFKTALLWNLALNAAVLRQRVLFVSLEMTLAEMALLALSKFSGLDRRRIEEAFRPETTMPLGDGEADAWESAREKFAGLQFTLRLHGHENGRDMRQIINSARSASYDAVMVDHLGMIGRDSNGRELDQLSAAIHGLRGLSRGEAIPGYRPWVVATSQLNREIDKGEESRIPRMADFRGSSRIEHDTDVAIGLQRRPKEDDGPLYVLDAFVLKNRFGPPGVMSFDANGATGLVVERRHDEPKPPPNWQDGGDES